MPPVRDPEKSRSWTTQNQPAVPSPEELTQAKERLREFFRDRTTRPGVVARRLLGQPRRDDPTLVEQLIAERRRKTRLNGSTDGSLVRTAWTVWELLELDNPVDHSAVVRTVGWVLTQQDKPGHFAEGCDPDRHERRVCRHFLNGFFSAGTADQDIGPLTFPSGVTVEAEHDARFAASCFALRTVLRAGEDRRAAVLQHVDGLVELLKQPDAWGGDRNPDLVFFALGVVALAPIRYRPGLEALVKQVVDRQHPGGGWSNASLFHACDMLLLAPTAAARDALRRATPLLCSMQQPSGAFDSENDEEKALIGLKVLLLA